MDIAVIQYLELNIFGVAILSLMFFYVSRMRNIDDKAQEIFRKMLLSNIIILVADSGILLMRDIDESFGIFANHIFCVLYYLLHAYFGYLWFRYCIRRLFPDRKFTAKTKILVSFPCVISSIFVLLSPFTHLVYNLTENNHYQRGSMMWLVIACSYFYWILGESFAIAEMIMQHRNREKSFYITLLCFPIPTIIGNIVQLKFYGLTVVWICSAISLLILFAEIEQTKTSRDPLTNIYNRRRINSQLSWEIAHLSAKEYLYAIMIDIDKFKAINDNFGHITGDDAIKETVRLIKESVQKDVFVGRLGGDEFIIIGRSKDIEPITTFINKFSKKQEEFNEQKTALYTLSASLGYAMFCKSDNPSVDSVISVADKELYKAKAEKKKEIL